MSDPTTAAFWEPYKQHLADIGTYYALRLLYAIFVFIVGYIAIKIVMWIIEKALKIRNIDASLRSFAHSLIKGLLYIVLFVVCNDIIGIDFLSLTAFVAALCIAVGLSLGGIFSNFVSGILILALKPYVPGDLITVGGYTGVVNEITILTTVLHTGDNIVHYVYNTDCISGGIANISRSPVRRVDMVFNVGLRSNTDAVLAALEKTVASIPEILVDETHNMTIKLSKIGNNSLEFVVRPFCKAEDYWKVYWSVTQKAREELAKTKNVYFVYAKDRHDVVVENKGSTILDELMATQ